MEPLNIILLITIIVGLLAILYITIYNKLQTEKSKIEHVESLIDNALREKFDLVKRSNLVILETLKTKKEYLKEYIALETQDISNFDFERELKTAESIINNLFHDHENLEKNENMISIIHDFKECNEKLTACILYYNKEVAILNNITRKFPNNIVAKIHHIKIKPFFDGKDMQDDNNNDFKF